MWKYPAPTLAYYSTNIETEQKYKKVAIFDLDHTLVKPLGRNIHPKSATDWEWMKFSQVKKLEDENENKNKDENKNKKGRPTMQDKEKKLKKILDETKNDIPNSKILDKILDKLIELKKEGYLLIIVSNQSGADKPGRGFILDRISDVVENSELPFEVYAAIGDDIYRKPNTTIFEKYIWPKVDPNFEDLFYVGDAAGREHDFADSDRKFAYNIHLFLKHIDALYDIKFYTPEEFFLGTPNQKKSWSGFNPIEFIKNHKNTKKSIKELILDGQKNQKVFLLIGPPASGKSTFSRYLHKLNPDLVRINQDECKTKPRCLKLLTETLQNGKSAVIDNTNPSKEVRAEYIAEINDFDPEIPIYILHMNTFDNLQKNKKLYKHLNIYRERMSGNKRIPDIAYNMFYKKYEPPEEDEADGIINIPFHPKFKTKEQVLRFIQKS